MGHIHVKPIHDFLQNVGSNKAPCTLHGMFMASHTHVRTNTFTHNRHPLLFFYNEVHNAGNLKIPGKDFSLFWDGEEEKKTLVH